MKGIGGGGGGSGGGGWRGSSQRRKKCVLKPHLCKVKLGFTEVCIIFLIFAQKHRLWVLV